LSKSFPIIFQFEFKLIQIFKIFQKLLKKENSVSQMLKSIKRFFLKSQEPPNQLETDHQEHFPDSSHHSPNWNSESTDLHILANPKKTKTGISTNHSDEAHRVNSSKPKNFLCTQPLPKSEENLEDDEDWNHPWFLDNSTAEAVAEINRKNRKSWEDCSQDKPIDPSTTRNPRKSKKSMKDDHKSHKFLEEKSRSNLNPSLLTTS